MVVKVDGGGKKFDDGKARYELMPPEALEALAQLYTAGAQKYGDRNWERGMSWGRLFGALMRHAWLWFRGESYDPETKAHHMIAVAWNAVGLYVFETRKVGTDDRNLGQGQKTATPEPSGESIGATTVSPARKDVGPRTLTEAELLRRLEEGHH